MQSKLKVAVVQDGSVPFDAAATTEKTCRLIAEASAGGAQFVLFPEAFLGTYPKGLTFDAPVGRRLPEGREEFPVFDQAAVLYADLDNATLIKSKMDFDPVGHYARADVFSLKVDRSPKVAVQF